MERSSKLRDFIAFLGTIKGDIANVTAPPYFLAPVSVVEIPSCWTERPSVFTSAALETNPEKRALAVLRWIMSSLKSQFYIGQDEKASMRKPLNAFLGELFFGHWTDETSTARMITEQVSHHPPITACYMWDEEHSIRGIGYVRVEMSFNGFLNVKQTGHAMLHLDKYNEHYLIPFPHCKVKGFLSGRLYPELGGTYHIISSSGFISEITFLGEGFFSGVRNSFTANMYRASDNAKTPIYTASGQWSGSFTISNPTDPSDTETCVPGLSPPAPLQTVPLEDQDPWETRNAWKEVLTALTEGDIQTTIKEKSKLEEAQRAMRRKEAAENTKWEPKFFSSTEDDALFHELAITPDWKLDADRTKGVWRFDQEKARKATKPYRDDLTPFGEVGHNERKE
ncbi:hypothetical protein QBC40DRAFT_274522 [Triangularia verruculosa]|uniref:Oxysterol-binding protein n=1 Tax=Triangularia verruculosa TaxID=2587418 RepID=A0AAN7B039_9PEZI|nr:hypothetical protein QBC40DRAFT_274522 [Triangularia verruculosa]